MTPLPTRGERWNYGRRSKPGVASTILGRGFVTLGRALQAQGKAEDAQAAFGSAVENLAATLGPDHRDTRAAMQLAQASGEPQ